DLIGEQAVPPYQAFADAAKARGAADEEAVCVYMVEHEKAQVEFARRELAGAGADEALEPIVRFLRYPLKPRRRPGDQGGPLRGGVVAFRLMDGASASGIEIEGLTLAEMRALSPDEVAALVPFNRPLTFRAGTAMVLAEFEERDRGLVV